MGKNARALSKGRKYKSSRRAERGALQEKKTMSDEEWEAVCDGCGKCCESDCSGFGCPSLDTTTNRCMNYESRLDHSYAMCLKVRPGNVKALHRAGMLPDSCAYVRLVYGLPRLPRLAIRPAKLIPFILAGPEHLDRYKKSRAKWDEMKGNAERAE